MADPLSLENLWMPDFDAPEVRARRAAREAAEKAEQQRFKDMYGDRWEDEYDAFLARQEEIQDRKDLNRRIYRIGYIPYDGIAKTTDAEREEFDRRLREVYGDQYDAIKADRVDWDPRVGDLLVQEAIRKGSYEELPDELLDEYHRRIGGVS